MTFNNLKFLLGEQSISLNSLSDNADNRHMVDVPKSKLRAKTSHKRRRGGKLYLVTFMLFGIILASCSSSSTGSSSPTGGNNGGGSTAGKPLSAIGRIQLASSKLTQGKTAQLAMTGNISMSMGAMSSAGTSGGKINMTLSGTGNIDSASHYYSMDMTESFPSGIIPGAGGGSYVQQVVVDGNTMYLKSSSPLGVSGSADQWYTVDTSGLGSFSNSTAMETALENPSTLLTMLESVGSVVSTGSVTQNGQTYTEYKLDISFAKIMSTYAKTSISSVSGCFNSNYSIPITVLIDSQNQLHSITMSMTEANMFNPGSKLATLMGSMSIDMSYSLVFSNYGKSFNEYVPTQASPMPGVSTPPASGSGSSVTKSQITSMC